MVHITALNEFDLDKMCIYRIWFGNKYYIGSTANSFNRLCLHQRTFWRWFTFNERVGKNSVTNICNHVINSPYISTGYFELLLEIFKEEYLPVEEYKLLQQSFGDSNCLNYQFTTYRKVKGVEIRGKDSVSPSCTPQ